MMTGFFGSHLQKYICCKQISCINVANSKCEKFHIHSPDNIQSCLASHATDLSWHQSLESVLFIINFQQVILFQQVMLCILEYMFKKNMQVRHRFMDLVTSVKFLDCLLLDCLLLFFRSFLNQNFSVPFNQNLPSSCFCIFFVHAVIRHIHAVIRHISLHSL